MSSTEIADVADELATDYANYAKIDLLAQTKCFHDGIEDVMMRLEEFQTIIGMVQTESAQCRHQHVPKLQQMQREIKALCKRINALEHVIATANAHLCNLEAAVDNAEAELGVTDRLFGILNPLYFFKKNQEPLERSNLPNLELPIYKTDDYFHSS